MTTPPPPRVSFGDIMRAGHDALGKNELALARSEFESAALLAESDEERAEALHFTAWALMSASEHQRARQFLARILDLPRARPDQKAGAMHLMAHSFINQGRANEADEWFDRLVALDGAPPGIVCEARCARGYRLRSRGQHRAALEEFASALAMEDGFSIHRGSALYHSALSYRDLGDFDRAVAGLEQFLAMTDVYPEEKRNAETLLEEWRKTRPG